MSEDILRMNRIKSFFCWHNYKAKRIEEFVDMSFGDGNTGWPSCKVYKACSKCGTRVRSTHYGTVFEMKDFNDD